MPGGAQFVRPVVGGLPAYPVADAGPRVMPGLTSSDASGGSVPSVESAGPRVSGKGGRDGDDPTYDDYDPEDPRARAARRREKKSSAGGEGPVEDGVEPPYAPLDSGFEPYSGFEALGDHENLVAGSLSFNIASTRAADEIALLCVWNQSVIAAVTPSPTPTIGGALTWTLVKEHSWTDNGPNRLSVWRAVLPAGTTKAVTVTAARGVGDDLRASAYLILGRDLTSPIVQSVSATGASSATSIPLDLATFEALGAAVTVAVKLGWDDPPTWSVDGWEQMGLGQSNLGFTATLPAAFATDISQDPVWLFESGFGLSSAAIAVELRAAL